MYIYYLRTLDHMILNIIFCLFFHIYPFSYVYSVSISDAVFPFKRIERERERFLLVPVFIPTGQGSCRDLRWYGRAIGRDDDDISSADARRSGAPRSHRISASPLFCSYSPVALAPLMECLVATEKGCMASVNPRLLNQPMGHGAPVTNGPGLLLCGSRSALLPLHYYRGF